MRDARRQRASVLLWCPTFSKEANLARRLLVVHYSQVMRNIVRGMIHSNLGDVVVSEAKTGTEALSVLQKERFDFVLSSWEVPELDGLGLFARLQQLPSLKALPFVLMSSKTATEKIQRVRDAGIRNHLMSPFAPAALVEMVNTACDPIKMRASMRYAIFDAEAMLEQGPNQFRSVLVNLSAGGFLCDIDYEEAFDAFAVCRAQLKFPADYKNLAVADVISTMVSVNVLQYGIDQRPTEIRLGFKFVSVPPGAKGALDQVLLIADAFAQRGNSPLHQQPHD